MKEKRACPVCGREFIPKKRKQKYCSPKCASESQKKYNTCQHCGKKFWRENAFRMKYCSKECQRAAFIKAHPVKEKPKPVVYRKTCEWCGEEFETKYHGQKYCCHDCTYEANKKQHRDKWAENYKPRTYICKECGSEFTTECGNKHSVFCCKSCADKYKRRLEHQTDRHKNFTNEVKKRRKMQLRDGFVEKVAYDRIYERDQGICQICGLPVIYDKHADNNWSGTIDHIEPLSLGGSHSMANCQLAHRVCNSMKNKATDGFAVDWKEKSKENNYWRLKYEKLVELLAG